MSDPPHPAAVSRPLLLAWCAWLMATWAVTLALHAPQRTWVVAEDELLTWRVPPESFIPIARGMLALVALTIGLVWPAWRLSLSGVEPAGRRTAVDATSLWLVAQVVIWPMVVLVDLPLVRLALISAALGVWTAAVAACVGFGRRSAYPARRTLAMILCVLLTLGPWAAGYLLGSAAPVRLSPLYMIWTLCGEGPLYDHDVLRRLTVLAALVLPAWLIGLTSTAPPPPESGAWSAPGPADIVE